MAGFRCAPEMGQNEYIATVKMHATAVGFHDLSPVKWAHPMVKTTKHVPTNSATNGAIVSIQPGVFFEELKEGVEVSSVLELAVAAP
jgi:hypothetical protein